MEDDIAIQTLYKKLLNLYGFDIVGTANNGAEAVSMFKLFNHKPDVILMDHRMPVKDGIEATKEIFDIDHNVKVIFASADMSVKEKALSMGIVGFLSKPFSLEKLVKKIEGIISKEAV